MASVSWSQLLAVTITSFVCTLGGLYLHHRLTIAVDDNQKHQPAKQDKVGKIIPKSKLKATQFWDIFHFDKSSPSEWFADWSELKPFILSQITKVMNHNENRNKMNKSDVKILILGNGLSEIPIHLHKNGFTNLTVTDISVKAINTMKQKYSHLSDIKWSIVDCTEMSNVFKDNSYDLIFEKGVSDTLQYRRPSKESNALLQKMFSQISRILDKEYGKYLCITPRRKVPLLRLIEFDWTVKRIQIRKFDPNNRDRSVLYMHICTKIYAKSHLRVTESIQNDRRKEFEKGCDSFNVLRQRLNMKFEPLIQIGNIEKDVIIPFIHFEQKEQKMGIIKEIEGFYVIHGIIEYKRKYGKKLMFYRVSVLDDVSEEKRMLQCVAERSFVAKLTNPKLKQEFATNYLTKCGDEVRMYGKLGLTNQGRLSLFVYYLSLIQYHCNWKYE